jgi:diguanylate cyclase (GGDEF)-like protein/PAS domain S-box-containing protein
LELSLATWEEDGEPFFTGIIRDISDRRASEQRIRQLAAVVNATEDSMTVVAPDGTILAWNPAAERMYGYGEPQGTGPSAFGLTFPQDDDETRTILARVLDGEPVHRHETRRIRHDGRVIDVSLSISPIRDETGAVVAMAASSHDITARKLAERTRAAQLALSQVLPDAQSLDEALPRVLAAIGEPFGWIVGAFWRVDPSSELLRCEAVWEAAGARADEFVRLSRGKTFARGTGLPGRVWQSASPAWIPDVLNDANFPRAAAAARAGVHMAVAVPILRGGEAIGVIEFFGREEHPDDAGVIEALAAMGHQVGQVVQRKRAEAELGELHRALDQAVDSVGLVDQQGRFVSVNPPYAAALGCRPEDLIGSEWTAIVDPDDRSELAAAYRRMMIQGKSTVEATGRRRDGSSFDQEIVLVRRLDDAGDLVGHHCFMRDISERKHAERELARSKAQLADAQQIAGLGSWEWDIEDDRVRWSDELYRIFGVRPASLEASFEGYLGLVHPEDRQRVRQRIEDALDHRRPFTFEHRIVRPDGGVRVTHCQGHVLLDRGRAVRMVGTALDVTDRRRAEDSLREWQQRFAGAFKNAPIGMGIVAPDGRWLQVNRALCEIVGYTEVQLLEKTFQEITHPGDVEIGLEAMQRVLRGDVDSYELEKRYVHAAGHPVWIMLSVSAVHDQAGQPLYLVAQIQDITERKRAQELLQHLADEDPLTGLLNRRRFTEELERHIAYMARYGGRAAALLLDLDFFKRVNDGHGHGAGDELLARVGEVLRDGLRETDVVARLGGDEFVVLAPEADEDHALQLGRKLIELIRTQAALERDGVTITVTASVGIRPFEAQDGLDADTVLAQADLAMYDAKQHGRDQAAVFRVPAAA